MKKYIIVSIIVAALFIGGSIAVVRAQQVAQAKTMSFEAFSSNLAGYIIQAKGSTLDQTALKTIITGGLKNISNTGGLSMLPENCTCTGPGHTYYTGQVNGVSTCHTDPNGGGSGCYACCTSLSSVYTDGHTTQ